MPETLGGALPLAIDRAVDRLTEALERPPGQREGAMRLRLLITTGLQAMAQQDIGEMIRAYENLRDELR